MSSLHMIFVYGTLKRGFCRSHFLAGQQFLGAAQSLRQYRMFNCGTYPGLKFVSDAGCSIIGELWAVDAGCLARLDREEGVDEGLYARRVIELATPLLAGVAPEMIEAYFYLPSAEGLPDCGECWV